MTKRYFPIIERHMPDANEEEKDEAQMRVRAFLLALLRLHRSAQARDNRRGFDTVDQV